MGCIVRNKNIFYKRVLLDVWGHFSRYFKVNKIVNFMRVIRSENRMRRRFYKRNFIFNYRRKRFFRRKKRYKKNFIQKRYLKNFYLVLSYRNFRRYMTLASKKVGYYYGNYFSLLEGRIFMMAYRSTFITNIFIIRYVIDKGLFTINGKIRRHYNYSLIPGDLFQVSFDYKNFFYKDLLLRLKKNNILFKVPEYLFPNFNFMFVFFWRYPKIDDIIFPIWIDIQVGSEYYYP